MHYSLFYDAPIRALHPGVRMGEHYSINLDPEAGRARVLIEDKAWVDPETGEASPRALWDEALLGPFDQAAVDAKAQELAVVELRAAAISEIEARGAAVRAAVVGTEPAKIGVYKLKQEIAERASAGDAAAMAAIEAGGEPAARGMTAEAMADLWRRLGAAWTSAALRIDAVVTAARAEIAASAPADVAVARDARLRALDDIASGLGTSPA